MVEVDPRLFVTCRLCLDVQGHFQINPEVQQQIKYCFDIEVEPFDGLPQLVCKRCENILRDHYAIKKNFVDKQKELKAKLQDNGRKIQKSPSPQDERSQCLLFKQGKKIQKSPSSQQDERTIESCTNETKVNISPPRLEESDSSNYVVDDNEKKTTRKRKKAKKRRRIKRLMSSSCDELDPNDSSESIVNADAQKRACNVNVNSWIANYTKYFACRICSQQFWDIGGVTKHIQQHSHLQKKFKNIFKMSCCVVMEKCDNKPNLCNSNKSVVYSLDSVIENKNNPLYYVKYHPKICSDTPDSYQYNLTNDTSSAESTNSDMSIRKKKRLWSKSSSETVVINRNSEHEDTSITEGSHNLPTVVDCIDLDDSSDNGSCQSNGKINSTRNKNKELLDSKPVHDIINVCHSRYTKQRDFIEKMTPQNDRVNEDFLQHKVLSIGRKIINNRGFNCTGLLRFLEYKDLSVIWKEKSVLNASNDGKYVRIATTLRNKCDDKNNTEWEKMTSCKFDSKQNLNNINLLKKLKALTNFRSIHIAKSITNEEECSNSQDQLPRISSVFSHTDLEITKTESDNLLQKLLNKNPVSNPKQLPKKVNSNENFQKSMIVFSAPNTVPFVKTIQTDKNNEMDTETMPIVTSTVSLAKENITLVPRVDSINSSNNQQTSYIKVKPVSELMPAKSTTNINSYDKYANGAHNTSLISNVIWPNPSVTFAEQQLLVTNGTNQINSTGTTKDPQLWHKEDTSVTEQHAQSNPNLNNTAPHRNVPQYSSALNSVKEYVLLDTVEFPNTKTASPFQYLRDLLLVHNITLLDANQPTPAGSVSLVKLKLVYQQEKCQTITLCLTLFCSKNIFCIQIKDTNLKEINIKDLSANWQWQLLKIYNDDVIKKVIQTAATVSPESCQYTISFFSLLRSIKLKSGNI